MRTLLLGQLACAPVPRALAPEPAAARLAADEVLWVLASRFGPIELGPRFAALRPRLARASLVPSRVFDDPSVWTEVGGEARALAFHGSPLPEERYAIEVASSPPVPQRPGEYRGLLGLRRLRAGEFEWHLDEALALGQVRVRSLAAAGQALMRLAETVPAGDARAALGGSLPRTAASLGRVWSLDRFSLIAVADGARQVEVEARLHPERLKERLPRYSEFLQRHVSTLQLTISLEEPPGSVFWRAALHDGRLSLSLKLLDGALLPLEGPARRLGDRCTVRAAFSAKAGLFRFGLSDLLADVTILRGPGLGVRAAFQREPAWRMPFLIEPFVRGTLRRPFERDGATLGFMVSDGDLPDAPTTVRRDYRLAVRESWLVRWLGGNMSGAVSDFRAGAEAEADRFTRETVSALREDVRALLATP